MDPNKVFEGIGKQMLIDFAQIQSQIKHAGEIGNERELGLANFLKAYLPAKYTLVDGEIVDTFGQTSRQCDLIIYDQLNCPLLFAGRDYKILPIEPVLAMIEVKSRLSIAELRDASKKIKSVKVLNRENGPVAGIVFAYSSVWKTDPMGNIAQKLKIINKSLEPQYYIDLICVLDAGVICVIDENGEMRMTSNIQERSMMVWHELTPAVLLWFFIQLLDLLDGQKSSSPNYVKYSRIFEIGLVSHEDLT
jgi:hypothetical protein